MVLQGCAEFVEVWRGAMPREWVEPDWITDRAVARLNRGFGDRPMFMFLVPALFMSFALSAGIGVLLEVIDPVVLSSTHFEKIGSPALLGSIHRTV